MLLLSRVITYQNKSSRVTNQPTMLQRDQLERTIGGRARKRDSSCKRTSWFLSRDCCCRNKILKLKWEENKFSIYQRGIDHEEYSSWLKLVSFWSTCFAKKLVPLLSLQNFIKIWPKLKKFILSRFSNPIKYNVSSGWSLCDWGSVSWQATRMVPWADKCQTFNSYSWF